MQIEILQGGRPLPRHLHHGQSYVEAPPSGAYSVRLTNDAPVRRSAVLSVDGTNVIDGKEAGYDGAEFVLEPWQSIEVKGWLRSNREAAAFEFVADQGSYVAATGRGTKNAGVIGLAVFEEKRAPVFVPPIVIERHTLIPTRRYRRWVDPWYDGPFWWGQNDLLGSSLQDEGGDGAFRVMGMTSASAEGPTVASTVQSSVGAPRTRNRALRGRTTKSSEQSVTKSAEPAPNLGTAYGARVEMHTREATFERASTLPSRTIVLRYGTREKLREWGVPVDAPAAAFPNAFPAAPGFAPAPAGWQG